MSQFMKELDMIVDLVILRQLPADTFDSTRSQCMSHLNIHVYSATMKQVRMNTLSQFMKDEFIHVILVTTNQRG